LVYAEGNNPVSESVAFIAHRLISLKLDPLCHPLPGDTIPGLFRRGVAATGRRFDVSLPMKFLYALWFTLMVLAPRPAAAWLADRFLFPEKRPHVNRVLGLLHRTGRSRLTPVG
jgi:hypothetical protein